MAFLGNVSGSWWTRLTQPSRRRRQQTIRRVATPRSTPSAWTGWARRVFREPVSQSATPVLKTTSSRMNITSSGWTAPKRRQTGFFSWIRGLWG